MTTSRDVSYVQKYVVGFFFGEAGLPRKLFNLTSPPLSPSHHLSHFLSLNKSAGGEQYRHVSCQVPPSLPSQCSATPLDRLPFSGASPRVESRCTHRDDHTTPIQHPTQNVQWYLILTSRSHIAAHHLPCMPAATRGLYPFWRVLHETPFRSFVVCAQVVGNARCLATTTRDAV